MQHHAYSRTSAVLSIFLPAVLICLFFSGLFIRYGQQDLSR